MEEKELSIVIPSYQKGKWIINTIKSLLEYFPQAEIIVINDGSKDDTKKIKDIFIRKIVYLENAINKGKGYSLRKGFAKANGKYLIFTDADLPFDVQYIDKVYQKLKQKRPIVIGHREQFYNDKSYKKLLRPFLYLILKILFGFKHRDTQCGLKGFAREKGKRLFSLSIVNGFAMDIEILFLAKKLNYSVDKVIVKQGSFSRNSSTFNLPNILRIFFDLLIIRFHRYEIF